MAPPIFPKLLFVIIDARIDRIVSSEWIRDSSPKLRFSTKFVENRE